MANPDWTEPGDWLEPQPNDLRDWFAGMALQGWLAGDEPEKRSYPQEAAYEAYQYADAMLAAREAPTPSEKGEKL